ncbi:MAG: dihydroorotase [Bacteroidota bacterium]|jgi:dihydroorotase
MRTKKAIIYPEKYLIKNATVVNEGQMVTADVLIQDGLIKAIEKNISDTPAIIIDATGKYLLPGIIDCHVHFREPGNTHKGDIYSESKAAVAGGVTSFIDMPNTKPHALTQSLLVEKYRLASEKSLANFGFMLGVNADNIKEIIQTNTDLILGVTDDGLYFANKGNLLADNPEILETLFANCKALIAIHSEKESIIEENEWIYRGYYGENIPLELHPVIRSEKACYDATSQTIEIAKKYSTKLHFLHISTVAETNLFRNDIPLIEKNITAEVSVHHLWFSDKDYQKLGNLIKWNPAIKTEADKQGLLQALIDNRIDIVTSDHAPHTLEEKQRPYLQSMSGAPIIQHSLNIMLELYKQGKITLQKIVEKMCHNPAILYRLKNRGFIRKGYYADLVLVDLDAAHTVSKQNIFYKCGWSPLEGTIFNSQIQKTFVNGNLVYDNGSFNETYKGMSIH